MENYLYDRLKSFIKCSKNLYSVLVSFPTSSTQDFSVRGFFLPLRRGEVAFWGGVVGGREEGKQKCTKSRKNSCVCVCKCCYLSIRFST